MGKLRNMEIGMRWGTEPAKERSGKERSGKKIRRDRERKEGGEAGRGSGEGIGRYVHERETGVIKERETGAIACPPTSRGERGVRGKMERAAGQEG